ncbi:MAG: chaperonin GroEL [Actinomycetota bacterium]|nr:chaperonin GroEL [Actinomycetota bacterium]
MPKQITFDETARRALERGIDQLADAVKITLGPRGRHVVLDRKYGGPSVTNDGVTIAREIELTDPYENLGAQLAKSVATKTNDVAGDGTTTATVLAQAMVRLGMRNVAAGANPTALGHGIAMAADAIAAMLRSKATPVQGQDEIAQVATVSSRDPKIGALVGEAMTKVGKDGVITVEESSTLATELEITEGVAFDKGYISPYFVTDAERMETVLTDASVLLHREKISSILDLLPLLEKISQAGRPLLIVAEDVEGEALSTLVVNAIRKTLAVVAVKAPFFGDRRKEFMDDLAVVTGSQVIDPEVGLALSEVGLEVLGRARRIVVTKDDTTIVEGAGDQTEIDARAARLRREIDESDSDWDREKLQERLAKLAGGVAVIKVGAATETELKERKARIEDAVAATRAAAEEGIIPGGGVALVHAANSVGDLGLHGDEATGAVIAWAASAAPTAWIANNAGFEGSVVVAKVRDMQWGHGLDAETETYCDLVAAGIVDPVKVTRSAIVNAASIARMVITTESAVVDMPEQAPPAADHGHGHGHGPGGM